MFFTLRNVLNHDSEPNQLLSLARNYKRFNILIKKQKTSVFLLKGHNYNVQFFLGVYSIYSIIEYDYLNTKKLAKHDMQSCVLLMSIVCGLDIAANVGFWIEKDYRLFYPYNIFILYVWKKFRIKSQLWLFSWVIQ